MSRFIQNGDTIDFKNGGGTTIAYGDTVLIGSGRVGVALAQIAVGATGSVSVSGVFEMAAENTVSFSLGDAVYWDNTNKRLTKTASGNTPAGWITSEKAIANTTANVKIG